MILITPSVHVWNDYTAVIKASEAIAASKQPQGNVRLSPCLSEAVPSKSWNEETVSEGGRAESTKKACNVENGSLINQGMEEEEEQEEERTA